MPLNIRYILLIMVIVSGCCTKPIPEQYKSLYNIVSIQSTPGTTAIEGYVLEKDTKKRIQIAEVLINNIGFYTNKDGYFRALVEPGMYMLQSYSPYQDDFRLPPIKVKEGKTILVHIFLAPEPYPFDKVIK